MVLILGFYRWNFEKNKVLPLAPVDSVFYVQARQSFWKGLFSSLGGPTSGIEGLPFGDFYSQTDSLFGWRSAELEKDILPFVSQAAFMVLPNQDTHQFDWVFIFHFNEYLPFGRNLTNRKLAEELIKRQPNYSQISNDVFVLATSAVALDQIKEVSEGTIFPLAGQIQFDRLNEGYLGLYFNPNELKAHLGQDDLLFRIFDESLSEDLYLNLVRNKGVWRFKIVGGPAVSSTGPAIIRYLPDDFSFFISGINLAELFESWGEVDESLSDSFDQAVNSFKMIYQFDLQQEVYNLFNQAGDLAIFRSEDKNRLGLDFVLAIENPSSTNLDNLEKLVKIVLAQKSPRRIQRVLPDGTTVVEIKADPEAFVWQSETAEGKSEIRRLEQSDLGFELAYSVSNDKILVGSKAELIRKFFDNQGILLGDMIQACGLKSGTNVMIFNKGTGFVSSLTKYLPNSTILVNPAGSFLNGCVL